MVAEPNGIFTVIEKQEMHESLFSVDVLWKELDTVVHSTQP